MFALKILTVWQLHNTAILPRWPNWFNYDNIYRHTATGFMQLPNYTRHGVFNLLRLWYFNEQISTMVTMWNTEATQTTRWDVKYGVDHSVWVYRDYLPLSPATMELTKYTITHWKIPSPTWPHVGQGAWFEGLSETWYKPREYSVLNEACPTSYIYMERARSSGHGGG